MIRLPSTMGAVDRIFRKFAQDTSWLVRYVVRQRNSWRDVALGNIRLQRADRKFIKTQRVINRSLRAQNKKLREQLVEVCNDRNREAFTAGTLENNLRATHATRDEFFRNWKDAERKLNAWRDYARAMSLHHTHVTNIERGHG